MHPRPRPSLFFQIVPALVCGVGIGAVLGWFKGTNPWARLAEQVFGLAAFATLGWLRALAVPLMVSSIVLGGVGLEPMRSMGKLAGKTVLWMVVSSLLAACIAVGVAALTSFQVNDGYPAMGLWFTHRAESQNWTDPSNWVWGWLGLVLLSLAFGYYRNQIDEGRGKMFTRFCQGLDEMLTPLLRWTRSFCAVGIFLLTVLTVSMCAPSFLMLSGDGPASLGRLCERSFFTLLVTLAVYMSALSAVVWWKTRVNPWRLVPALMPAMMVAASGQSMEAALPLTMDAMRRRAGISTRVASVTLSLCAVLHRDGMALGWTSVVLCLSHPGAGTWHAATVIYIGIAAVVVGCGLGALTKGGGLIPLLFLGASGPADQSAVVFLLGGIVISIGGAVSVFSHACAAVIIAKGEGEYWVPGPPPNPDELQGLKNDLETADS